MSSSNYNVTVNVKRLPLFDKADLIIRGNSTSAALNGRFEYFASIDPKFKLITKVHVQSSSIISKDLSNTSDNLESQEFAIEKSISKDPKFTMIPKDHLQSRSIINKELSSASNQLEYQKLAIEQIISKDPKFSLIPKVHLQSCSIINKELSSTLDNLESQEFAIEKIISKDPKFTLNPKDHLQSRGIINKELSSTSNHLEYQKLAIEDIISKDPKFLLIPKVHLQSCSIINKELSSTLDNLEFQEFPIEKVISKEPKFMLNPKDHLQSRGIINKELSSTSNHLEYQKLAIEDIISKDPKFSLIPKVHIQSCTIINKELSRTSDHLESQKVAIEKIISNDPKFMLIPKVHLQIVNITDKLPNLPNTKFGSHNALTYNGVSKISISSNNKSKAVESYFKGGNSRFLQNGGNEIIKTIKYLRKEAKKRKRGQKVLRKSSSKDIHSSENNLGRSYIGHVPVYPQSIAIIAQKQREKECLSDSLSNKKKKTRIGRPENELLAQVNKMGREEELSDSHSDLYDKEEIRQKVSPKKRKYGGRVNVKQNNNVKVVINKIQIGSLQNTRKDIEKETNDCDKYFGFDKGSEDEEVRVFASKRVSTPIKNNHNVSLFDDSDISPIRNISSGENSSPNKDN